MSPRFFRSSRTSLSYKTPEAKQSDVDFVRALRAAGEREERIHSTLEHHSHLSQATIYDSLMELTIRPADAVIALRVALILNKRTVVQRAAKVIVNAAYLSDAIKKEAASLLRSSGQSTITARHEKNNL